MSKKVLYIDDNKDLLDATRIVLEANGHEMTEARTGAEGLEIYKNGKFDLILVDLMMERVDAGVIFATEIKALGNTTPVYMLSSVGEEAAAGYNTQELGLGGSYQKPFAPQELLGLLSK
jgi:DNA-binding response OmpR family regulator